MYSILFTIYFSIHVESLLTDCLSGYFYNSTSNVCENCPLGSYSFGGTTSCSSCPSSSSTLVSSYLGCRPSSSTNALPIDTSFYLSGSQTEGVSAFSSISNPSGFTYFTNSTTFPFAGLVVSSGSYLSTSLLSSLPVGSSPFTVSSWVKCNASSFTDSNPSGVVIAWGESDVSTSFILSAVTLSVTSKERMKLVANISTFAGSGTAGFADGIGTNARFNNPYGVTVDSLGNVYVADTVNQRIRKITPSGNVTTIAGSGTSGLSDNIGTSALFTNPTDVAFTSSGILYVSEQSWNHRIRSITLSTASVTTLAGSTLGFSDGTGANAKFFDPFGVDVDVSGNIFVADTFNNRIRKITSFGLVTTLAGNGQGFVDGTGSNAMFYNPLGVSVESTSGNVYVADTGNVRIRKITSSGVVTTLAGSGTAGYVDGIGTSAMFSLPLKVAVDVSGSVFVADGVNHRIRKITSSGVVTTLTGSGTAGYVDAIGTNAMFNFRYGGGGLAFDAISGSLYVADTNNHRIRKISFSFSQSPSLPGPLPVCDSTWHHIALTYSGSSAAGNFTAFIDGERVSSTSVTFSISSLPSTTLRLGYNGMTTSTGELFSGSLSDIRVFNRSLLYSEIKSLSENNDKKRCVTNETYVPFTGSSVFYTIPNIPMSGIAFYLWGAGGGGGGRPNPSFSGSGGAGAFVSGILYNVLPGTRFRIIIGAGGGYYYCSACPSGSMKLEGYCVDCAPNNETGAGGVGTFSGGGRTALQIWNTTIGWEEVATAGGGGGAGQSAFGGAGGCNSGEDGSSYCCVMDGGRNAADGSSCLLGPFLRGISTRSYSGGGSGGSGSGRCGGIASWDPVNYQSDNFRGAGGGSSWTSLNLVQSATCVPGYRPIPGEEAPYRAAFVANGGQGGNGGHGAAVLHPFCGSVPVIFVPDGIIAPLLPTFPHTTRLEDIKLGRLSYTFRCITGYIGSDSIYTFNFTMREWMPHDNGIVPNCIACPEEWSSLAGATVCSPFLNRSIGTINEYVRFFSSSLYQYIHIPKNITLPTFEVVMWGAGGGGSGGAGSFVTGYFDASSQESLRVIVGRSGRYNDYLQPLDALGGGGFGTFGGGGRTAIQRFKNGMWIDWATAAGGGGRGGSSPGAGGCNEGFPGDSYRGAGIYPGGKVNKSGGCDIGSRTFGVSCYSYSDSGCGGGGGGYCGGMASTNDNVDGGAGGASWTLNLRNGVCFEGIGSSVSNSSHPLYVGNAGNGDVDGLFYIRLVSAYLPTPSARATISAKATSSATRSVSTSSSSTASLSSLASLSATTSATLSTSTSPSPSAMVPSPRTIAIYQDAKTSNSSSEMSSVTLIIIGSVLGVICSASFGYAFGRFRRKQTSDKENDQSMNISPIQGDMSIRYKNHPEISKENPMRNMKKQPSSNTVQSVVVDRQPSVMTLSDFVSRRPSSFNLTSYEDGTSRQNRKQKKVKAAFEVTPIDFDRTSI